MHLDYPFNVDKGGRTGATTDDDHVRDLVEQVLFTTPGERVNRPSFGSGVLRLVSAGRPQEGDDPRCVLRGGLEELCAMFTVSTTGRAPADDGWPGRPEPVGAIASAPRRPRPGSRRS